MASNAEIAVVLKLVADQFSRELKKQQGVLGDFVGSINRNKVMLAAVTGAMFGLAKSAANYGDHLAKTSQKVGMSVQSLAALEHAAKLADVSQDELSVGLVKLTRNASDTAKGTGESVAAFAALGLSVQDASGKLKSSDVLFAEIAERFAQMEDGAGKTALAVQLFGKSGANMIPLLNAGKVGLKEAADEAKRLGLIISNDQARASEKFNDDLTRLEGATRGLGLAVGQQLIPPLNNLIDVLIKFQTGPAGGALAWMFEKTITGLSVMGVTADTVAKKIEALFSGAGNDELQKINDAGVLALANLNPQESLLTESARKRLSERDKPRKDNAPSLPGVEEAKSAEKLSKALLDAAKAREKLAQATLEHRRAVQEEQRGVEDAVLSLAKASGAGEDEIARRELEIKQRRLAEDRAFQEQKLRLLDESAKKQTAIIQGSAQEQAAHLIRAGQADKAKEVIETSKRQVEQVKEEARVNREAIRAEIDKIAVKEQLIQVTGAEAAAIRDKARTIAQAEADLSRVEQQASLDRSALDLARREGKLNDIELLQAQIRLERELREARIAAAQATVARINDPGSAEGIKAQAELDRLIADNASRRALEDRQRVQSTKEYQVQKAREAAQMELEIAELQYADEKTIAEKRIKLLDEEMQQRLLTVKTGSEEEARIREYYAAKQKDVADQANGGFFDGWTRGLADYVRNTKGAFGMAQQMAQQTAQAMQSGFQNFFFDWMQGRITTLKDMFRGVLNFAQQILSQIAAQMATKGVMDMLAGGAGASSGGGMFSMFSGLFGGGMGFAHGGVVPPVQYFAAGGVPAFTNGDSVRAMLTPGERVLTREQNGEVMDLIRRGGSAPNITVITENNTGNPLPPARVEQSYDQLKGVILRVIYEERGKQSPIGGALRAGAR